MPRRASTAAAATVLLALSLLFTPGRAETTPELDELLDRVQSRCRGLLAKVSEAGHSHFELAALCRARAPIPVCHDALRMLGPSPWAEDRIATTCRDVQAVAQERLQAKTRRLQAGSDPFSQVQSTIDEAMKAKSLVGICTDMQLDECAAYKAREYPLKAKEVERAIVLKYQYWNGAGLPAPLASEAEGEPVASGPATREPVVQEPGMQEQQKFEQHGGPDVGHTSGANLALTVYASCVTLLLAAAVGSLTVLRARRAGARSNARGRVPRCSGGRGGGGAQEAQTLVDREAGGANANLS